MHNKIVDKKTATLFYIVVVLIVSFLFHYCQSNIALLIKGKSGTRVVQGDSFFIRQVGHHPLILLHLLANTSLSVAWGGCSNQPFSIIIFAPSSTNAAISALKDEHNGPPDLVLDLNQNSCRNVQFQLNLVLLYETLLICQKRGKQMNLLARYPTRLQTEETLYLIRTRIFQHAYLKYLFP